VRTAQVPSCLIGPCAALPIAKRTHPHIHFEQIDGFDISRVRQLGYSFTKVYIDISGCRDIYDVIKMVAVYEAVFRPEIIVVKSTKLKRLVSRCVVWDLSPPTTCANPLDSGVFVAYHGTGSSFR